MAVNDWQGSRARETQVPLAAEKDTRPEQTRAGQEPARVAILDWWLMPVALAYLSLTLLMTWPVIVQLSQIAGEGNDLFTHLWTFHWVRDALLQGKSPYFTERIFYPVGVSLANHNIAWLQILFWIPVQALVGEIPAYNLVLLGGIAANGVAMYLLARELLTNRAAAFVAGLIFAFWPYVLTHNDHPNWMFLAPIPLALLFLRRVAQRPRWRDLLLASLFLALIGWTRLQLMVMAAIPIGIYMLALLWRQQGPARKRTLGRLLLVGIFTTLLMLPITLPVAVHQLTRAHPDDLFLEEQEQKQTDLLAFFTPTAQHPLWESRLEPIYGSVHRNFDIQNQQRTPYLGYTALFLALVGTIGASRSRIWLLIFGVLILFALGPILRINGQLYPSLPMPYRLVEEVSIIRLLRQTDRINVVTALPLSILAGYGLATILNRGWPTWMRFSLTLLISLFIVTEYAAFPFPQSPAHVPTWLSNLRDDPEAYAILQLPNDLFGPNKRFMYYQTVHEKPLVNGKVARVPRVALSFWEEVPLLAELSGADALAIDRPDVSHQLSLLHEAGVRYVVIDKQLATPLQLVTWREWFTLAPLYEDEEVLVYTTAPRTRAEFDFVAMLTPTIGLLGQDLNPLNAVVGGAFKTTLRLGSTAPPEQTLAGCLQLLTEAGVLVDEQCKEITPVWPTRRWPANALVRDSHVMWIGEGVEPGRYRVQLHLADAGGRTVGNTVDLAAVTIAPHAPTARADVNWADTITLRDYRLEIVDDTLQLTFYWHSDSGTRRHFKFFVHLIDAESGELVAQVDRAPHDWRYPTYAWEPGERVHDEVSIPLAALPAGRYRLAVGWYSEASGTRLPATLPGSSHERTSVPLTTITLP